MLGRFDDSRMAKCIPSQPDPVNCPENHISTLIVSGQPYHEQNGVFIRKDSTVIPVSYTLNPILEEGMLKGAVLVFFNLTERTQAEAVLKESQQQFRALFESSPDAVFVEDFDGNVLDVSPAACQLHGLPREELIGCNIASLVPEDERENVAEAFARLVAGEVIHVEGYSLMQDGSTVPVEIRVNPIVYAGQPALLLYVRDITERKQAKEAVQKSEERYRTLVEHAPEAIVVLDVESGCFIDSNSNAQALYGLSREALHQTGPEAFSPER